MTSGDPRCRWCAGKGGTYVNGAWFKCKCVKGTPAQHAGQRRLNSIGTDYRSVSQRIKDGTHNE